MEPRYSIKEVEARIYGTWERSGYFNPDICVERGIAKKDAEPFSIVLPPPNVTGELHIGHAAMLVVEDIMVRWHRMQGRRTLWVPGTDHAAIATQSRVEKELYKKEKKTRHDLGREEFLRRVADYAAKSRKTIVRQIKRMGASLDWSREAYTLDAARERAVRTAFKMMYDLGLIYRGNRIVNWDTELQTTVSDDEVEWVEKTEPFYYLKYGPFTIATARPETKFGDKYVVMHPDDKRYAKYRDGEKIHLEWITGPITATVVKDKAIDMSFGTGVMTITPWHDMADFEIAERHELDREQIIDLHGKLLPIAGEFAGMHIKKARPLIVEKLRAKGLLEKVDEKYVHRVATNSRGDGVIEPQVLKQWFVAVNKKFKAPGRHGGEKTLKELMRDAVAKNDGITIIPERFQKIYFNWIDNLHDWCISRQIWFGHRIPVWIPANIKIPNDPNSDNEAYRVSIEDLHDPDWVQDPDTLDTWFSSGLWPFSTLGWPEKTADLATYFPNSVLETGYDIIFFWVARMILMSEALIGKIPFYRVYLHGLVRDEKGRKMSKSLENGIDPLEMADKYGADATRLSLVIGASAGNDLKLSEDRIRGYRNFATKIWNIARFVEMSRPEGATPGGKAASEPDISKRGEMKDLTALKKEVAAHLARYEFHLAAEKLYHYVWHTLADKIVEAEKKKLRDGSAEEKRESYALLERLLLDSLKMLHPFMPFVTEEVYGIFRPGEMLMIAEW
jgi:valyl-tRNA synthetase